MEVYDYYVTPEEYRKAAEQGINAGLVNKRIRVIGWNKERAITEKPMKRNFYNDYIKQAAENNISRKTFYSRLDRGMKPEEAAVLPRKKQADLLGVPDHKRRIPDAMIQKAKENGISYKTLYGRVKNLKWSVEEAATVPPLSKKETGKRAYAAVKKRHGDINGLIFGRRKA